MRYRAKAWHIGLLALMLLLSGLGADAATATSSAPMIADTPLGQQLSWVLAQVNGGAPSLDTDTVAAHFTDDFLAVLPADQLIGILQQLAAQLPPVAVGRVEGSLADMSAAALLLTADQEQWRVTISVEPAAPHRIDDLFFAPAPAPIVASDGPTTWAALDRQLTALAPQTDLLAAELTDGQCRPIHALNANRPQAIASNFKLYVLGALAREVAAGKAAWAEPLAIRDDWKSLPSGDYRLDPAGTSHTLQDYAAQMVSVSDNTAADHLMHRIGRENVEAALTAMGNAEPTRNEPFLTTREWFALKSALPDSTVNTYLAAPTVTKRMLLATVVDPTPITEEDDLWTEPLRIGTVEWFASASDLCRAMAALRAMAQQPGLAPVADVLSLNPDLPFDARTWSYVGFKGGDETGVMSRTWLLRRADGRWFVLTACLNNPEQPIDENTATELLISAVGLLARTK